MKPGEITQDQAAAIAFLEDPASHGGFAPDRIDTHAAIVFLAGERAYKLKRAVWYPFLDFSTIEKRRAACEAEIRLNRRTAPDIYLRRQPITREADGSLSFDGAGAAIDWVVVMRRFGQEALFDGMAARGELEKSHISDLADETAGFHRDAEPRPDMGGLDAMRWVIDDNIAEMLAMETIFDRAAVRRLERLYGKALNAHGALLEARREAGKVRHCHGDLHLRNICLIDGRPVLFDCLEFDEALACIDVLYDFAFLLMDLEHRGRRDFANLAFNRYLWRTGDIGGLALLPLFMSCRAAVRAKVEASGSMRQADSDTASEMRGAAREYLASAEAFLSRKPPRLIGIGGESGSGKSTVAAMIAPALGGTPGALVVRSDVTRKRLFGREMEQRLPEQAYTREATGRTYAAMISDAEVGLAAGFTVIADAVFADPAEREDLRAAARQAGAKFTGIWLDAELESRLARVGARQADASDATAEFLRRDPVREHGDMNWRRIDAGGPAEKAAGAILESIGGRENA